MPILILEYSKRLRGAAAGSLVGVAGATFGSACGWADLEPARVASRPVRATVRNRGSRLFTVLERTRVGTLVKRLKVSILTAVVASLGWTGGVSAQDKPQTTSEEIPKTTVKFDLVKLPAGKVKVGEKEFDVKPVWIGKTEVTWDEYDIYWQRLDLTAKEIEAGAGAGERPEQPE